MLEKRHEDFHNRLAYLDAVDPTFAEDLVDSYRSVLKAIMLWGEQGYRTLLPPITINDGNDDGDFYVLMPISVKHLTREFHSLESYPFKTVFVGTVHSTDSMLPGPYQVMIFNPGLSGAIIVPGTSGPHWTKTTTKSRGRVREFYQVEKQHCRYTTFDTPTYM